MIKKTTIVRKRARYFLSSEMTDSTEHIWIVCHGYGQLANYFLNNFKPLASPENVVVAPEGLHRFYWEKFSGRVVASWMTREDREDDIIDYVGFLDQVYDEVIQSCEGRKISLHVLGFSQGTATVCRWLTQGRVRADSLVLWAGNVPPDIFPNADPEIFRKMKVLMVAGDRDEFITAEELLRQQQFLEEHSIPFELLKFEGRHEITEEALRAVAGRL